MAEGGKAEAFCSEARMHDQSCEYFSKGGQPGIPESQVEVDPEPQTVPESQVDVDAAPTIPESQVEVDPEPSSYLEMAKAGAEGLGEGYLGPLAPYAEEKLLGVSPEDIAQRAQNYPYLHGTAKVAGLIGGAVTGTGEAGLIMKAGSFLPKSVPILGRLGAATVKGALEMGLFQGGDEVTKALLGKQDGNPEAAVSSALVNIKNAALMGAVTGGAFSVIGSAAQTAVNNKIVGPRINSFLAGIGAAKDAAENPGAASFLPDGETLRLPEGANPGAFNQGVKFYNEGIEKAVGKLKRNAVDATIAVITRGKSHDTYAGALAYDIADKMIGPFVENVLNKPITNYAKKYVVPAVLRTLASESPEGVGEAANYAMNIAEGMRKTQAVVESCFTPTAQQIYDHYVSDKEKERLKAFVEGGGVNQQIENQDQAAPQGFASGGKILPREAEVSPIHSRLPQIFPEQAMILSATRGRIYSYLNQMRPLAQPKLSFDDTPPDKQKERDYDKAVELAIKPLNILRDVKNGTLTPDNLKHANAMYPDVMHHLRMELTKRVLQAQLDGEKPSYKKRQAMSLFLGAPLDTSLAPQAVMTAQAVFAGKAQAQTPQPAKNKRGTSSLTNMGDKYQTPDQSREARLRQ